MTPLIFWFIAALMVTLALIFVVLPLWRAPRSPRGGVGERARALYEQRHRELTADEAAGLLGAQDRRAAEVALARQLLADADRTDAPAVPAQRSGRLAALASLVLVPVLALGLYLQVGTPEALWRSDPAQPQELQVMVDALAQRLARQPDNGEGWLLLGRSYLLLQRPRSAVAAFDEARARLGDQPEVLVDYAQAMALSQNGDWRGTPRQLLDQVLAEAPDHPKALWLGAMSAAQRGEMQLARTRLTHLLAQQPPGSEVRQTIQQVLNELGGPAGAAPALDVPLAALVPDPQGRGEVALAVSVSADPAVLASLGPQAVVFIYAQDPQGSSMPVAAAREPVSSLPLSIRLDDADAVMPTRQLSDLERVVVTARLSASADALADPAGPSASSPVIDLVPGELVEVKLHLEAPPAGPAVD